MSKTDASRSVAAPTRKVSVSTMVMGCVLTAIVFFALGTRANMLPVLFGKSSAPSQLDYSSLNDLYGVLRDKYDGDIDTNKLLDGAKHGMIDALGDPHTVYLNADESKQFSDDLSGTFEGIGAELGKVNNQLTILNVLADSPAQQAGLQNRDVILKINDEDASTLTVGVAVKKIRGQKGTTVKLSVFRDGEAKDFTITRNTISSPSVKSEILNGNIGYLRISRFGNDTVTLATQAAQNFKNNGVTKVILDLRGNGGGYLTAGKDVASLWLDNKVVVSERTKGVEGEKLYSGSNPILGGIKTVVLVDEGSASASEIVAGALKDHKAATLVGVKTYGKGSVQSVEDLLSGGQLKVTIAKWYTPNGVNIDKEGITPDKEVKLSDDDIKAGKDPQKDAAIEMLK